MHIGSILSSLYKATAFSESTRLRRRPKFTDRESYAKYRHFMIGAPREEIAAWNRKVVIEKLSARKRLGPRRHEQLKRGLQ